jgi:predicted Zn finger-like uncharacterized protein
MSLITRCPACETMFRVVPDQLRISGGWVRCGHCSEVFDASGHLQNLVHQPDSVEAGGVGPLATPREESPARSSIDASASLRKSALRAESAAGPDPRDEDVLKAALRQDPLNPQPAEPPMAMVQPDPDSVLDTDLSFVRQARRKAFWRRPVVRAALVAAALLLVAVLALQVVLHERDRLAALEPQLKPWLVGLCAPIGCTVKVPRQIESLVIDSSTISKLRGDSFRLSFTVRSTAGAEVATPAIELTLLDAQDQAVARRVFLPGDIGAGLALAPRGEWSPVLHIGMATSAEASRVAGHRLLAFYP